MRNIYAIILLLIFSLQVLPIKELGALLASSTFNEEVPAHSFDGSDIKAKADLLNYSHATNHSAPCVEQSVGLNTVKRKEEIPFSFVGDIFSPPPNLV